MTTAVHDFDAMGLDREVWREKLEQRIRVDEASGCWLWVGAVQGKRARSMNQRRTAGYGCISFRVGPRCANRSLKLPAHRLMWWVTHPGEKMDAALVICHSVDCVNSLCVNPDHLRLDTTESNYHDVVLAGSQKGINNSYAKLTEEDVVRIREQRASGRILKDIARDFGVHLAAIDIIAKGIVWKDAGGPIHQPRSYRRRKRPKLF